VHGDIKLENIGLVRPYDITDIKLLDFGGSYKIKKLDDEEKHSVSEFNISASPHYIPPEMASDAILIKERELIYTDFWELGVICFVLLTGHYPFGDDQSNLSDIKKSVLRGELKWPKKINISLEMKKYVSGFLKKNPRDRYGN
jgi:serine/threonine protein kinase